MLIFKNRQHFLLGQTGLNTGKKTDISKAFQHIKVEIMLKITSML